MVSFAIPALASPGLASPSLASPALAIGYDGLSIAPNLLLAVALGALVGLERQFRQRFVGLTTHALVALGAAAFSSLALLIGDGPEVRMGAQVVTGIGFLGAGLIMRDGLSVRGLSSAATVWATGAIGTLAGYGQPIAAIEAAGLVIAINLVLPRLGGVLERFAPQREAVERFYVIELKCAAPDEADIRARLLAAMQVHELRLHALESHALAASGSVEVEAIVYCAREEDELVERLVGELSASPQIFAAKWTSTAPPE
ncbi:putative Mg2+ transporter-C (MgtC) family protein [Angulomicrobium tetraedrale]|uniref:Protein MgtC n=1 Tax=Ancylobacter tetraedralis TaxID=217068 RepID=A0A839Z797_9HYPH|nr:MgtC/SapB family protein [Ancylobacter tetraedralis]MBB3770306.1 putative Mg2+ transporter-C (MgtC) family protein [Ancylobacter tetraedralis]